MIKFNKLFIPPFSKGIYLDCEVCDLPYYENVYIDKVIIETQDTFSVTKESSTPVYTYIVEGNKKSIRLFIKDADMLVKCFTDNLYFIKVKAKGIPASDTPCGMDNIYTIGVVADTYKIYRKALKYMNRCLDTCEVPKALIDFILRYKAFSICLKTRDFTQAIYYWKKFIKTSSVKTSSICRCNG